jgi:DNA-3-methyladenine glycosylase
MFSRDFYAQEATVVARALLGAVLVRQINTRTIRGRIVETEAYRPGDAASHSFVRQTARNAPMWEAPGHAYVYFTYGVHWLLNAVCEPVTRPAAVLIRAIEPLEGQDLIAANRAGRPMRAWTSGPARLTQALQITGEQNRADLTTGAGAVWIEIGPAIPDNQVRVGPRIGLGSVPEPWRSMAWRWWISDNPYVSR